MTIARDHNVTHDPATSMARQILYRFTACALTDPRTGSWKRLREFADDLLVREAASLLRSLERLQAAQLGPGEQPPGKLCVDSLLDLMPNSAEAINAEYEQTFGLLVSSPCPPYETEYIDSKFVFQRSNGLADLNGFYRAFGLRIPDNRPERPDHIVLELEFMSHLIGLERAVTEIETPEGVERQQICHAAQARFLREHLTWWVPAFSKLLRRIDPGGFYGAIGGILGALIAIERTLFGLPVPSRGAALSKIELSEMCDSCQMGT